jgi:hypothetical protein
MADFNIRSDSVDVEQIMKQIRARIQEKRGVDYTEDQIREIAAVRLEKFLDPKNLRSDLLEQFRRSRPAIPAEPPPVEPPYTFSDETIYDTHRGSLRFLRRLFNPLLKLLFNPNPLITALHKQVEFNVDLLKREQRRKIEFDRSRADWNALYYEVLHNLVLETTRNGIELKNLKMRVEALASRLDFSERRVRALEGVVQYRPEVVRPRPSGPREAPPQGARGAGAGRPRGDADAIADTSDAAETAAPDTSTAASPIASPAGGESPARRRRRRRRGRRGAGVLPGAGPAASSETADASASDEDYDADESDASEELAAIAADDSAALDDDEPAAFGDQIAEAMGADPDDSRDAADASGSAEPEPSADDPGASDPNNPADPERQ